jgi:hypothetical protein
MTTGHHRALIARVGAWPCRAVPEGAATGKASPSEGSRPWANARVKASVVLSENEGEEVGCLARSVLET